MTRKTVRWVIGAAAGLVASSGLASGTALAGATSTNLPQDLFTPTGSAAGVSQLVPFGAVTGILSAGQ